MHAKLSFAHRLQTAKMASSRTSAQNNGPWVRAAFSHLQCANHPFWPLVSKYTISKHRAPFVSRLYIHAVPSHIRDDMKNFPVVRPTNSNRKIKLVVYKVTEVIKKKCTARLILPTGEGNKSLS